MSVVVVQCARGARESGHLIISLDYPGSTIREAIHYAQDHTYRATKAWEIFKPEDLPPKPLAVVYSFVRRPHWPPEPPKVTNEAPNPA